MAKLEQSSPTTPQGESIYRLANQKFAEPTRLIKQVEEGANIFKKNSMDIRDERALLNAPELEAYNIGVFRALEEKLGSPSGRNFLTDITKNRNTAKQLYETLGHEKYPQLVKILKGEKSLKSIYTVNTGSQTAGREAALSELGLDPLKDAGARGIEGRHAVVAVADVLQAGVHRAHQHAILQRGEAEVERRQQVRVGIAHFLSLLGGSCSWQCRRAIASSHHSSQPCS